MRYLNPTTQLTSILNILTQFQNLSGLQTNVLKTKYALFGHAINDPEIENITGFSLEPNPFRLLGIYLTGNLDNLDINWQKAIKAIKTEIGVWSTTKLPTTAKLSITKTCLLSKLTRIASILPLPKKEFRNEI